MIWLTITLAALAIALAAAIIILTVGRETEERPGTIDLTGVRPRAGYARAEATRVARDELAGEAVRARFSRPASVTLAERLESSRGEGEAA